MTLDDVVTLQRGHDLPAQLRRPGTVPVMGSFGVTGWHDDAKVKGPGVTVGRSGASFGVVSRIAEDFWPLNTCLYVKDFKGNDPYWTYHALSQVDFQRYNSGSAQPSLNRNYVRHIPVMLPTLPEQKRIAGVLAAFDNLIETDRNLAQQHEQAARSVAQLAYPHVPVGDIASVPKLRQTRPSGLVEHFSIPAFDEGGLPRKEAGSAILSGKYVLTEDSVLLSRLNPATPRAWIAYPGEQQAVCSPEFVVMTASPEASPEEIWAVTSTDAFWTQMRDSVSGTTNSHQRVDKRIVPRLEVPDVRVLSPTTRGAIRQLVRTASELRHEAEELTHQRDELLPLLMSGRVRISDVPPVTLAESA